MTIAEIRDIVIIIAGSLLILLLIGLGVGGIIIFAKVKKLLKTINETVDRVKETIVDIRNKIMSPFTWISRIIEHIRPKTETPEAKKDKS